VQIFKEIYFWRVVGLKTSKSLRKIAIYNVKGFSALKFYVKHSHQIWTNYICKHVHCPRSIIWWWYYVNANKQSIYLLQGEFWRIFIYKIVSWFCNSLKQIDLSIENFDFTKWWMMNLKTVQDISRVLFYILNFLIIKSACKLRNFPILVVENFHVEFRHLVRYHTGAHFHYKTKQIRARLRGVFLSWVQAKSFAIAGVLIWIVSPAPSALKATLWNCDYVTHSPGAAPKTNLSLSLLIIAPALLSLSRAPKLLFHHICDGIRSKLVKMTLECSLDLSLHGCLSSARGRNIQRLPFSCCCCVRVCNAGSSHTESVKRTKAHACSIPEWECSDGCVELQTIPLWVKYANI
jgi:hypothetical protein